MCFNMISAIWPAKTVISGRFSADGHIQLKDIKNKYQNRGLRMYIFTSNTEMSRAKLGQADCLTAK